MAYKRVLAAILGVGLAFGAFGESKKVSDDEIAKALIAESIAIYPGNCPCPYNSARNGSRCGKRSAYSRRGGYSPLCYQSDITPEMYRKYREERQQ